MEGNETKYCDSPGKDFEKELGQLIWPLKDLRDRAAYDWSFLNPAYEDVKAWRSEMLTRVMDLLPWLPVASDFEAQWGGQQDKGSYVRREVSFLSSPGVRVPAVVLMPKSASPGNPAGGLVALHCMGGLHTWGKEKIVSSEFDSNPAIVKYRAQGYDGEPLADQFAELGYAVIVIDSPLFGERLPLPSNKREELLSQRKHMSLEEVYEFHRTWGGLDKRSQFERHCRMLGTSPSAWIIRDDLRTVDFLASLPQVDGERLFCAGLSYGGYRTLWLTALCDRIRAGAGAGWCSTHFHMLGYNVEAINYFSQIQGLWPHMDFADLVSMACPRRLLAMVGQDDDMFPREGKEAFFDRIARVYTKAGAGGRFVGEFWPGGHKYTKEMTKRAHEFFAAADQPD
ncbi:MAG: prolyl oligopeptidase family serine peptidase [Phycisphaerae bacterium]|nr:prolyl oligopeptidase family serine peptidase [Phycisphaerae bacterium]